MTDADVDKMFMLLTIIMQRIGVTAEELKAYEMTWKQNKSRSTRTEETL